MGRGERGRVQGEELRPRERADVRDVGGDSGTVQGFDGYCGEAGKGSYRGLGLDEIGDVPYVG